MTPTAQRYLTLLCQGMAYKEIAAHCKVSHDTVRKLFRSWRVREGCKNNEQLVYRWVRGSESITDPGAIYP